MLTLNYSKFSRISAEKIAEASEGRIRLNRGPTGDVNWGRATADSQLNPDITTSTNKHTMRLLFKKYEVPAPELYDIEEAREAIYFGHVLVGRPDSHSKGRGYWLCNNMRDFERALKGTRRKKAATHFMEYIEAEHEYRVHVFIGKSIRISEKQFEGTDGNHKLYTTIKPTFGKRKVRRAAKKAVEALGLDFAAVDVLVDGDGEVYVLECNAAPGLGGSLPKLYADKFIEWSENES